MAENPAAYADAANKGLLLGYPVKIQGQGARPDNGIEYHCTIKYFDRDKACAAKINNLAKHLPLNPPDPKTTTVKFEQYLDRNGYDVYVISLFGNSCEKLKEMNGKFAGISGFNDEKPCNPHVSVDKATWDKVKSQNPQTAEQAGIQFGSASLFAGQKILNVYHHKPDSAEPMVPDEGDMTAKIDITKSEPQTQIPLMKPYVSEAQRRWAHTPSGKKALGGNAGVHEWDEATKGKKLPEKVGKNEEPLEKGNLKNAGIALGMAGALAGAPNTTAAPAASVNRAPASIQQPQAPKYDHHKMLQTISQVESSGGKNTNHGIGGGPIHGNERAFGKYGLMPETIREVIKGNKDLKARHSKALALKGDVFNKYMADHKGLEDQIADRHLAHLEKHFGQDPDTIGYAWLEGIRGAHNAKNKGVDIKSHWHVKKIRDAYGKGR